MKQFELAEQIEEETLVVREIQKEKVKNLVVYNDEVNSFEFVIETLIKICKQEKIQAEQCTYLIHYTGKCAVKHGTFEELEAICVSLLNRGLTAQIE